MFPVSLSRLLALLRQRTSLTRRRLCPSPRCLTAQNTDYAFREGLKKKEEEFEVTAQSGADSVEARVQEKLDQIYHVGGHSAEEERHARATNAIYKLEHAQDDKRRVATEAEKIQTLFDLGQTRRLYSPDPIQSHEPFALLLVPLRALLPPCACLPVHVCALTNILTSLPLLTALLL